MAKVELKQPIVDQISEEVKEAVSVVLVDYRGISVADDTKLRKELREAGIIYKVYKNTLMKRAFEGTDFAQLEEHLDGPSAVAISKDDATAAARIISKYAKTAKALELKAGVVEGALYDEKGLNELAKIPSREELLSKLLGSIQSPITNFARVIKQIAEKGGADAVVETPAEEVVAEEAPVVEAVAEEAKEEVVADEAPVAEEAKTEEPAAE
jgi:large subunit ribosomal protein L10